MGSAEAVEFKEDPQEYPYDAIVVLGAEIRKDPRTGRFIFHGLLPELDGKKTLGARSRALAAVESFRQNLAPLVLVTGGKQEETDGNITSKSELLAEYLINRLHLPDGAVVAIGHIGNTFGNAQDTAEYVSLHPEVLHKKKLAILSNDFHLERAMEIFNRIPFFSKQGIELQSISAESLIAQRSPRHMRWIEQLGDNSFLQRQKRKEEQGLRDLKNGSYNPTHR